MTDTLNILRAKIEVLTCQGHQHIVTRSGTIISVSTKPMTYCTIGQHTRYMPNGRNVIYPPATNCEALNMDTNHDRGYLTLEEVAAWVDELGGVESIEDLVMAEYDDSDDPFGDYLAYGDDELSPYGRIS
jgi:hypothetical protein